MLIMPDIKLVEAHDLPLMEAVGPLLEFGPREGDATSLRFTLNDLRRRGRYLPALLAPTDNRAAAWVGDRLLPELSFFPDDVLQDSSGISVWEELARSQGEWASGTQKRSRMKQGAVIHHLSRLHGKQARLVDHDARIGNPLHRRGPIGKRSTKGRALVCPLRPQRMMGRDRRWL
jgi:hypothetical protein